MAVIYDEAGGTFSIHTKHTTYQMLVESHGFLLHLYYGQKAYGNMSYLLTYYDRGFSGNPYDAGMDRTFSLDVLPQEYPCYGTGDYRSPAVRIRDAKGVYGCDLRFRSYQIMEGKYGIEGLPAVYAEEDEAQTLEIVLEDEAADVRVILKYGVLPGLDVITRTAEIVNTGEALLYVDKAYSSTLDLVAGEYDILHFYGRHGMEHLMERTPAIIGNQSFGSRRGTSSHQHNPFIIIADRETTEDAGACYGMSFLYSGNFTCEVEKDQFLQTRMQMGIQEEMFEYPLKQGEILRLPEVAMAYTKGGLSALSAIYHRLIRRHVCRGVYRDIRRPILINNWEATYFDFNGDKIEAIAKQAAELGIELLVLDDGWFGVRDTDNTGLGDWFVNEQKMGGTLASVADKVRKKGLKFGLWIEPEMVSEDSILYREHPDFAFMIPGRKPVRGRNQLVLDFSREEVADAVFDQIAKVIDTAAVSYIKMDMNRSISDVYNATEQFQNQGKILHQYVLGVYRFLEKLLERYPDILIEGCSGGGGRFDAGMLYYTPQIWCSDNTDAIDRIKIQHGTSYGYPISAVGSHVSAVPNHQTGREVDIHTRSIVAMAGSFGYELDLGALCEEDKEAVRMYGNAYKKYWRLIQNGDYVRLHNPEYDKEMAAWAFVSEDKREALVNIVSLDTHCNAPVTYIRCRGLEKDRVYRIEGQNTEYCGSALMCAGIPVPVIPGEYHAWQLHLVSEKRCVSCDDCTN